MSFDPWISGCDASAQSILHGSIWYYSLADTVRTYIYSHQATAVGNPKLVPSLKDMKSNDSNEDKINPSVSFVPDTKLVPNTLPRKQSQYSNTDTRYADVLRGSKKQ